MELILPTDVTLAAFALSCAITLLGAFVKGTIGFAQPLVMISGMGMILPPQTVVAGMIIPIVVVNILQVKKAGLGEARAALRSFGLYIAIVCGMILLAAQALPHIPGSTMLLILGVPVVGFSLIQLLGVRLVIPPHLRKRSSIFAGFLTGLLGGLVGTWGPPTVLYLLALETPKARQMAAQGVIYGLGALALLVGHLQSGVLNSDTIGFSVALVVPSVLGMWIGFAVQDRMDQEKFRKITLVVLVIAGFNLIRKGILG